MAEDYNAHFDTLKKYGSFHGDVVIRQVLENKKKQGDHSGLVIHKNIRVLGKDNQYLMPLPAGISD